MKDAFATDGSGTTAVVALFLIVNSIVLYNALLHPATIGYDAGGHLRYIAALSHFHLPSPTESVEFFSPPLAYALGAVAMAVGRVDLATAARIGQVGQFVVSMVLMFYLLKVCELMRPRSAMLKLASLGLCALPIVYYKTFAQVRGETWLALCAVLLTYQLLLALRERTVTTRRAIGLGLVGGLALLARQWGVLLLLGVALFGLLFAVRRASWRWPIARAALIGTPVAFLVGGWFYVSLLNRFGSVTTFALGDSRGVEVFQGPRGSFSLARLPRDFLWGAGDGRLFSAPVRSAFPNQVGPIAYSETWGDYWMFFLVSGHDDDGDCLNGPRLERALERAARGRKPPTGNYAAMTAYLGRVNRAALLPTIVLLGGLLLGFASIAQIIANPSASDRTSAGAALALMVVTSLAGYLWFLVSHYSPGGGSTIKATYMLQVFPLLALLGGEAIARLHDRSRVASFLLVTALALVGLHNAPAMFTRYATWLDPVCGKGRAVPAVTTNATTPAYLPSRFTSRMEMS